MITHNQNKSSSPVVNIFAQTIVIVIDIPTSNGWNLSFAGGAFSCFVGRGVSPGFDNGHNLQAPKENNNPKTITNIPSSTSPGCIAMTMPCTSTVMPTNPDKIAINFFNHWGLFSIAMQLLMNFDILKNPRIKINNLSYMCKKTRHYPLQLFYDMLNNV
jgi:hypothetical protein